QDALNTARHDCLRLRCSIVHPEHLLLCLSRDPDNLAARALATLNIRADNLQAELEKTVLRNSDDSLGPTSYQQITFSLECQEIFKRANEYRLFFGREKVA